MSGSLVGVSERMPGPEWQRRAMGRDRIGGVLMCSRRLSPWGVEPAKNVAGCRRRQLRDCENFLPLASEPVRRIRASFMETSMSAQRFTRSLCAAACLLAAPGAFADVANLERGFPVELTDAEPIK